MEEADGVLCDFMGEAIFSAVGKEVCVFGVVWIGDVCRRFLEEDDGGMMFADGLKEVIKGIDFLYVPGEDGDMGGVSSGLRKWWWCG